MTDLDRRNKATHDHLVDNGLLDRDQPTEWAHARTLAELEPWERAAVRRLLNGEPS